MLLSHHVLIYSHLNAVLIPRNLQVTGLPAYRFQMLVCN